MTALPGIAAQAAVAAGGLAGGADPETDEALRDRLLARIRMPPHGGNAADYVAWALAVPGVTRAWVFPRELGTGTVTLRIMMDAVRAAQHGVPQGTGAPLYSGDLLAVWQALDPVRPVTAELFVAAPLPLPLDVTISGLAPDTPEVRAAVQTALADLVVREAVPGGTPYRSWLWQAVSEAAGERHHVIVAPAADLVYGCGQIAVPGMVSYV